MLLTKNQAIVQAEKILPDKTLGDFQRDSWYLIAENWEMNTWLDEYQNPHAEIFQVMPDGDIDCLNPVAIDSLFIVCNFATNL